MAYSGAQERGDSWWHKFESSMQIESTITTFLGNFGDRKNKKKCGKKEGRPSI